MSELEETLAPDDVLTPENEEELLDTREDATSTETENKKEEAEGNRKDDAVKDKEEESGEQPEKGTARHKKDKDAENEQEDTEKLMKHLDRSEKSVKRYQTFVIRLIVFLFIIWIMFFQIVGLTHMPNGDMHPRLDAGDLVLFYRLDTDVKAQDVIVIEKETPESKGKEEVFITRVVAVAGDTVNFENDHLIVNGHQASEPDIFYDSPIYEGLDMKYPIELKDGECFVLADKRNEGMDSRFFGPVKQDEIKGSVITIVRRQNL